MCSPARFICSPGKFISACFLIMQILDRINRADRKRPIPPPIKTYLKSGNKTSGSEHEGLPLPPPRDQAESQLVERLASVKEGDTFDFTTCLLVGLIHGVTLPVCNASCVTSVCNPNPVYLGIFQGQEVTAGQSRSRMTK